MSVVNSRESFCDLGVLTHLEVSGYRYRVCSREGHLVILRHGRDSLQADYEAGYQGVRVEWRRR